jgi:hypothetical protein
MMLTETVHRLAAAVDPDGASATVLELTRHDRYQASQGIEAAADFVAGCAEAAGLRDVTVHRWRVDGSQRWWTFRSPAPWTPRFAWLAIDGHRVVEYPRDSCSLATYSAPTSGAGVRAPLVIAGDGRPWAAAIVVFADGRAVSPDVADQLRDEGALGAVLSPGWATAPAQAIQRVELPSWADLFAFSVPPAAMSAIVQRSVGGTAWADVHVAVDRQGQMPVVTGLLPGDAPGDVVVHAHLCHPRPSANDNASGVAGALEMARVLDDGPRRRPVRFLWGPEFVGTAAYLHDVVVPHGAPPAAVINLDMIGEDLARCGGGLNVERGPVGCSGIVAALVEVCLANLPAAFSAYSGAETAPPVPWLGVPFVGASDHLLFADRPCGSPVASLSHHPDPFRHSSLDTLEVVDPARLAAVAAGAAACVEVLSRADGPSAAALLSAASAGAALRQMSVVAVRSLARGDEGAEGVCDPYAPHRAGSYIRAIARGGKSDVAASSHHAGVRGVDQPLRSALDHAADGWIRMLSPAALPERPRQRARLLARAPGGPFNLLAALADVDAPARRAAWSLLEQDRGGGYALLVALALAADGRSDADGAIEAAAFSSGLAIPIDPAREWLEALRDAGWLSYVEDA